LLTGAQEDLERMGEVENGLAIFALATYGEGDPTDNAIDFHQWLKDDCNGADLSGLKYVHASGAAWLRMGCVVIDGPDCVQVHCVQPGQLDLRALPSHGPPGGQDAQEGWCHVRLRARRGRR
jgi:hypothetical protein